MSLVRRMGLGEGGEAVENSAPENRSESADHDAWALVDWAVATGTVTVAGAATMWDCSEEFAAQRIKEGAIDAGWARAEELDTNERIERMLQQWSTGVRDPGQTVAAVEHYPTADPGWSPVEFDVLPADGTGRQPQHDPPWPGPSEADSEEPWPEQDPPTGSGDVEAVLVGGTGRPQHHDPPIEPAWSPVEFDVLPADTTSEPEQRSPPAGAGWSPADVDELPTDATSGPSHDEMLAGLISETPVKELADHWGLTEQQVIHWAGELAQLWWKRPNTTPLDQVRAELRALQPGVGPQTGHAVQATPLPEFTPAQRQVLGALRGPGWPTTASLAKTFGASETAVNERLKGIAEKLSIEGTATQILNALISRSRGTGDLAELELALYGPSPGEVAFKAGEAQLLAALCSMERPTIADVSLRLGVSEHTVELRLQRMGRALNVQREPAEILDILAKRAHPPADEDGRDLRQESVPSPAEVAPNAPVLNRDRGRKRPHPHGSAQRPGTSGQ